MANSNDYSEEDVGNIVLMEHVNLTVPDQLLATVFYIVGLGLTRDPYLTVGIENMWVNAGEQQFHLPTRGVQVIPGHIGLIVPDLGALKERLRAVEEKLGGTRFAWSADSFHVAVTCPWGNHFRCYPPDPAFPGMTLGIPYVEFLARPGTASTIGRFYQEVLGAPAAVEGDSSNETARVSVGCNQSLVFRETPEAIAPYDGHHIAIYVANFSAPYSFLAGHELITEEVRNHQFRFQEIVDPESGEGVFRLEHEVRSLRHPMYHRPMVNRNPGQIQRSYTRGLDALAV